MHKFEFLLSQGIVATCLRWGGRCHMGFVANFIRFPAVQKFWESVKIWQSYREFKGGNFFETQCRTEKKQQHWENVQVRSRQATDHQLYAVRVRDHLTQKTDSGIYVYLMCIWRTDSDQQVSWTPQLSTRLRYVNFPELWRAVWPNNALIPLMCHFRRLRHCSAPTFSLQASYFTRIAINSSRDREEFCYRWSTVKLHS